MDTNPPAPELRPIVHCVREVRVEVPLERKSDLEQFYCDLLGMPRWEDTAQIPGGIGLGHARAGLYLQYRHDPVVDPVHRRFMLVVSSLPALVERLDESKLPYQRFRGFSVTDDRVLIHDPVGHLLEIRQLHAAI